MESRKVAGDSKDRKDGKDSKASFNRLVPAMEFGEGKSDIFTVRFSPEEQLIAAGYGDSTIKIYQSLSGKLASTLSVGIAPTETKMPVPCLRFRPVGGSERTRNVILAAYAEGHIRHWHVTSGKCLHTITEDNQVYCLDYRPDGDKFATAGRDGELRIYDEATKTLESKIYGGAYESMAGHSNRVLSLKYHPTDSNLILTGGWDNTVQFWDVRAGHSVRSLFGPHICGDALDISGNEILVGSWRAVGNLQTYDVASGKLIREYEWCQQPLDGNTFLYASQFSPKSADLIIAGGSGSNEAKLFDRKTGVVVGRSPVLPGSVYSLDFDTDGRRLIVGSQNTLFLFDIKTPPSRESRE